MREGEGGGISAFRGGFGGGGLPFVTKILPFITFGLDKSGFCGIIGRVQSRKRGGTFFACRCRKMLYFSRRGSERTRSRKSGGPSVMFGTFRRRGLFKGSARLLVGPAFPERVRKRPAFCRPAPAKEKPRLTPCRSGPAKEKPRPALCRPGPCQRGEFCRGGGG